MFSASPFILRKPYSAEICGILVYALEMVRRRVGRGVSAMLAPYDNKPGSAILYFSSKHIENQAQTTRQITLSPPLSSGVIKDIRRPSLSCFFLTIADWHEIKHQKTGVIPLSNSQPLLCRS